MEMYPCASHTDPNMLKIDKTSYLKQGNFNNREKKEETMDILDESCKTPVELYRRKIDDNLKILNMKTTNVIQDSLLGVENICSKVRECLRDEPSCTTCNENNIDNSGRGDIMEQTKQKKIDDTATHSTEESLSLPSPNINAKENLKGVPANNKIISARRRKKDISENVKTHKFGTRPTFTSSATEKKFPFHHKCEMSSNSFDESPNTSTDVRRCEKRKRPTKKVQPCIELEIPGNPDIGKAETRQIKHTSGAISPKERFGEIEKDYEKVVKSLEMVEQMMASISRKMSNSEKTPQENANTDEKLQTPAELNVLEQEHKELPKTTETKHKDKVHRKKKIVDKYWVNEMIKRKKERDLEVRECEEIEAQKKQPKTQHKVCDSKRETFQELTKLSQPSNIKLKDSVSSLDALIENAVQELGNLVTDFDISHNSSDASFKITTVDDAKNIYEEYLQDTSSSNISESVPGEDCPKFNISKSFEELKETYLRENRRKIGILELKKKSKLQSKDYTDYKRNGTEKMSSNEEQVIPTNVNNSDQLKIVGSVTSQGSSDENASYNCKTGSLGEEIINNKMQGKLKTMAESNPSPISMCGVKEEEKDIITISMPYDKKFRSCSKCKKAIPKIQTINTEKLDDETIQITLTLKEDAEERKNNRRYYGSDCETNDREQNSEEDFMSENEFCECNEDFDTIYNDETLPNEDDQTDNVKIDSTDDLNFFQSQKDNLKIKRKHKTFVEDDENTPSSSENTTRNSTTINKVSLGMEKDMTSSGNTSSSEIWTDMTGAEDKTIDPMRQISLQCKKMIGDLIIEEDNICLKGLMKGFFNTDLIHQTLSRYKRCKLFPIAQDPDIKDIEPIVHRKTAVPDLHDRMELQIQQTDSFHGFLNLMDKNRRKKLIKHAEKQDHNFRCQMKACFRKKYPFKVVTASVPANYESKMKDRKEPEKKYINSLWFSPKDFKLRRNSRIFNKKRLEIYCQNLHKNSVIPKCKCKENTSKQNKRASNYSILVRSGTPLGRRPYTPTRWTKAHSLMSPRDPQRARLRHCDILDDLTMKDLVPFNAEYSTLSEKPETHRLEDSFFFKLANSEDMGDAEETLMQLITPRLSCTRSECKVYKQKLKTQKRNPKKQKLKKAVRDTAKNDDLQTLSTKAAAQLLIQNIGEIKSKKSSPNSQTSEKCLAQKDIKNKRSIKSLGKNSRKTLTQESKSSIYHKIEENLMKTILCSQAIPMIELAQTPTKYSPTSSVKAKNSFRKVEALHTVLKIPELQPSTDWRNKTVNKLFPYINDPENKVFQNITVLPVKVLYENETLNDTSKNKFEYLCGDTAVNHSIFVSKPDQAEACTIEQEKYPSVDDCTTIKIKGNKKRVGTPRSNKPLHSQDAKKYISSPTRLVGLPSPGSDPQHSIQISCGPKCRNDNSAIISNQCNYAITKITPKPRTRRSNSLVKSIETENGDFKNAVPQMPYRRSYNPNPWIPTSRIPDPSPPVKSTIRIKSRENKYNQMQPSKVASADKITVKEEGNCSNPSNASTMLHKMREKPVNLSKRSTAPHLSTENSQSQILVNKDKKIKFDLKPARLFYEVDNTTNKYQNIRASRSHSSSPSHKTMVDHLCALRSRNVKLQGSIQKAISIIEEKMVDVLSTKDRNLKKKSIERMEKEINNVLKMINEQNYKITETNGDSNNTCQEGPYAPHQRDTKEITQLSKRIVDIPHFTQPVVPNTTVYSVIVQNDERPSIDSHVHSMHNGNETRTPRKRATSKLIKLEARPSIVQEEESKSSLSEDSFHKINIDDNVQKSLKLPEIEEIKPDIECNNNRSSENDPLSMTDGQISMNSILPCPTPISSMTCHNLSHKAQKAIKKMSMKAFGKFADVVKTKTKLIINMTERIGLEDHDILPHPRISSALPVLAQATLPIMMKKIMPTDSDVRTTTVTPFISSHQKPVSCVMNRKANIMNIPITEIVSSSKNEIPELNNMTSVKSLSSFSESECFYTWPGLQRHSTIQSEDSESTITQNIMNKDCLTPFMKALCNLRKSRAFENRHQMIPLEQSSPSFTRLMDLLEGLSNINNRLNQKALRELQLMWNPERRCSFHSSMKSCKRISYAIDTKALSAHSIVQSLTSSSSETTIDKLQDNTSENNTSTYLNKEKHGDFSDTKEDTTEKFETELTKEVTEIYKLPKLNAKDVECNMSEGKYKTVNLELSEIHLISIPNTKNFTKIVEVEDMLLNNHNLENKDFPMIKDRYATLLKCFYIIFYGLIYFCMAAMNFTC